MGFREPSVLALARSPFTARFQEAHELATRDDEQEAEGEAKPAHAKAKADDRSPAAAVAE